MTVNRSGADGLDKATFVMVSVKAVLIIDKISPAEVHNYYKIPENERMCNSELVGSIRNYFYNMFYLRIGPNNKQSVIRPVPRYW